MSSRGLVRSMLIIGSAQTVNIAIAILRMKVLALLLGPAGVGLLGIYSNLLETAATASGLGMGSSGVREIASVKGEEAALSRVRRVLLAAHLVQGALAMVVVWLARERLSMWLLGDATRANEIGLVGLAVLLSLLAASQTALLQGMRRIGDLGWVTVLGALVGTAAGLFSVWSQGESGLIWFVVLQPLTAVLVALHFTRRLPKPTTRRLTVPEIWAVWRPMATLGVVFMLGGLATAVTLLVVRGMIARDLGLDAAGYFAASWVISINYVGILLAAMSTDYYPRLTEVIHDRPTAIRLINDQAQLGLAVGGPVLLLLVGLASWIMPLLYSAEFLQAAGMLQWQAVGNVFKLASWPLAFAFVAEARSRIFLLVQISFNVLFLALVWLGLPMVGLEIAGMAFLAAYGLYFGLLCALTHWLHGFRWEALSLWLIGGHAALAVALLGLAKSAPAAAAVASIVLAMVTGLAGMRVVLLKVADSEGRLHMRMARMFAAIGWPLERKA